MELRIALIVGLLVDIAAAFALSSAAPTATTVAIAGIALCLGTALVALTIMMQRWHAGRAAIDFVGVNRDRGAAGSTGSADQHGDQRTALVG